MVQTAAERKEDVRSVKAEQGCSHTETHVSSGKHWTGLWVSKREYLWSTTKVFDNYGKSFIACLCLVFWLWTCANYNKCSLLSEELTNKNISVNLPYLVYQRKANDCAQIFVCTLEVHWAAISFPFISFDSSYLTVNIMGETPTWKGRGCSPESLSEFEWIRWLKLQTVLFWMSVLFLSQLSTLPFIVLSHKLRLHCSVA